jgi:hypothetical protein
MKYAVEMGSGVIIYQIPSVIIVFVVVVCKV